jgi:hypothetical protein
MDAKRRTLVPLLLDLPLARQVLLLRPRDLTPDRTVVDEVAAIADLCTCQKKNDEGRRVKGEGEGTGRAMRGK